MPARREQLREHLAGLVRQESPDLVVFPEMALVPDWNRLDRLGAEPLDGPTVSLAAQLAAQHRCNLCLPIVEQSHGGRFNTAVYIDRAGSAAGTYRKHTPTRGELEAGIRAGADGQQPVRLDGLRIGTAICMDENYPDLIWNHIRTGVDLLVFPAYTFAGLLLSHWAFNCGVPVVCAYPNDAVVYDRDGRLLAEAAARTSTVGAGFHPLWVAHTLDLQSRIYHLDYNQDKLPALRERYGRGLNLQLFERDGRFRLTVVSGELDIACIEQEMGFIPLQTYIAETRALADRCREQG
jgi:predicted amidohydrolase